jgi:hypothetical protein
MVIGIVAVVVVALVIDLLLVNQEQQPVTPANSDVNPDVMVTIESPVEPSSAVGAAVDVPPADGDMDMIEPTTAMDDEMVATPEG